jgi:ribosome biogenesis GTPase
LHLEQFGWNREWTCAFQHCIEPDQTEALIPGRIVRTERGACEAVTERGALLATYPGGSAPPALGDWVALDPTGRRIHAVLPARNRLERLAPEDRGGVQRLAANFEFVAVVMGLDLDYNLPRLERYLALIASAQAQPVVFLNKRDICSDPWWRLAQVERMAPDARVELVSAVEDDLTSLVHSFLSPAGTMLLVGSSGAGKSTIVNSLLGHSVQATRAVRSHDGRGRHCTTQRRLFLTPGGRVVGDLPGLRLVGIPDAKDREAAAAAYDPHDPKQAALRKRKERECARLIRNYQRFTAKW